MHEPTFATRHGAILLAGCTLAIVGLALEPKAGPPQGSGSGTGQGTNGSTTNPVPQGGIPGLATADSNSQMIAVTGVDLTGSSILYLVDTQNRQLAIYQASSGSEAMQGVKLIGARKIDLDLQLEGYNDKSQYSYEDLEKRFQDPARGNAKPGK